MLALQEKFVEVQKKLNPAVEIKKVNVEMYHDQFYSFKHTIHIQIAVTNRKEGRLDISVNVIRDDKLVAGTKQRFFLFFLLVSFTSSEFSFIFG